MRMLFSLILAVLVNLAMGFAALKIVPQSNDLVDGCDYEGQKYSVGESWAGENCTKLTCNKLNETENMISINGCGVATYTGLDANCSLVYPPSSVGYPQCCEPAVVCT